MFSNGELSGADATTILNWIVQSVSRKLSDYFYGDNLIGGRTFRPFQFTGRNFKLDSTAPVSLLREILQFPGALSL